MDWFLYDIIIRHERVKFLQLCLIPVILINSENVAQWPEHFSLKHRLHIVERQTLNCT